MKHERKLRIVVLDDYQRAAHRYFDLGRIAETCEPELTIYTDHTDDRDELIRRAGAAEVVIVMRERSRFPAEVIHRLQHTKLIVTTGTRNRAIDVVTARARGITVCSTRGRDSAPSELTWAILMALMRRVPAEDQGIRTGSWGIHVGDTLEGRVLGILGFGRIGRRVARYAQAFGMDVIAHSRSLTRESAAAVGVEAVSREALFRESDVITLHLWLTDETRHGVGETEFGWMKRSAYLVNTARGALVDEASLVDALRTGRIAGAALDVFEQEPLDAGSPLLSLDNAVLTPHIGYVSDGRYRSYYGQAAECVEAYVRGVPIRVIN